MKIGWEETNVVRGGGAKMWGTLCDANRMYAQISLLLKIYVIYIVHIYNIMCRIITVEVYSA